MTTKPLTKLIATWQYRWYVAQGFIGMLLSMLTFAAVWTLLLGPFLQQFGLGYAATLLLLITVVGTSVLLFGLFLDRVAKFWQAQSFVGVVRNPWLYDRLYQKELLNIKFHYLPGLRALRELLAEHGKDVSELDAAIERVELTLAARRWSIKPGEEAYEDSG